MVTVTDTLHQTNSVSTTYKNIKSIARSRKLNFKVIYPGLFNWVPMPGYPEIQLCIQPYQCLVGQLISALANKVAGHKLHEC